MEATVRRSSIAHTSIVHLLLSFTASHFLGFSARVPQSALWYFRNVLAPLRKWFKTGHDLPTRHCKLSPPHPPAPVDHATFARFKAQLPARTLSSDADMGQAVVSIILALCSGAVITLAFSGDGRSDDDLLARAGRRYDSVCVCVCEWVRFYDENPGSLMVETNL